ncbi:MAG: helix-turn-helix transcriptional regulator [Candidatus Obscuribacterales bacterium]|jgi:transcriptional regulator with XRE-family HTH domain
MNVIDPKMIGRRLTLLREAKKISQRELSRQIKIAQSAISDFESGSRLPSPKSMNKLLEFFEISAADLMKQGEENPETAKLEFMLKRLSSKLHELTYPELVMVAEIVDRIRSLRQL